MTAQAKKVLVVDDNEDVRALYQLALQGDDYEVRTAKSRDEAQTILKETNWIADLLIVDFRMPGISIQEFLKSIDSHSHLEKTKVIAVSSFSKNDPIIADSGLTIPFFQKPASLDELVLMVEKSLT